MRVGVILTVLGGLFLGANLFVAIMLIVSGGTALYLFTGLIIPGIMLYFGVNRILKARHNVPRELPNRQ